MITGCTLLVTTFEMNALTGDFACVWRACVRVCKRVRVRVRVLVSGVAVNFPINLFFFICFFVSFFFEESILAFWEVNQMFA